MKDLIRNLIRSRRQRKTEDDFLETVAKSIVESDDLKELLDATISEHALDLMIEDATKAMTYSDRRGKFCFLLFVLGSAEDVMDEIKTVPFLEVVK